VGLLGKSTCHNHDLEYMYSLERDPLLERRPGEMFDLSSYKSLAGFGCVLKRALLSISASWYRTRPKLGTKCKARDGILRTAFSSISTRWQRLRRRRVFRQRRFYSRGHPAKLLSDFRRLFYAYSIVLYAC
jgi:hypothetical protein